MGANAVMADEDQIDQQADQQADQAAGPAFPANTPVAEMTVDQQAAYWKHQARRWEGRAKSYGDVTPETLAELREKAARQDELEHELMSDKDRAVSEAAETARLIAEAEMTPLLVETAFRVAIGDRKTEDEVGDFLADLNLPRFLTDDGRVDTAKVLARVDQFAPAKGTQERRGPGAGGAGRRGSYTAGSSSVASGREMFQASRQKTS